MKKVKLIKFTPEGITNLLYDIELRYMDDPMDYYEEGFYTKDDIAYIGDIVLGPVEEVEVPDDFSYYSARKIIR